MNRFFLFLTVIIFSGIFSCSKDDPPVPPPDDNLILKMEPDSLIIAIGDTAEFSVLIENAGENAPDLHGMSMEIVFDSTLIKSPEEDSVEVGSFWTGETQKLIIGESGILNVAIFYISDVNETGSDTLFTYELTADSSGTSTLEFQNISLIDENGNTIAGADDPDKRNGSLTIQ